MILRNRVVEDASGRMWYWGGVIFDDRFECTDLPHSATNTVHISCLIRFVVLVHLRGILVVPNGILKITGRVETCRRGSIIYATRPTHIINLLIMQCFPVPCYLVPLRPNYLPQYPILKTPSAYIPPSL